MNSQNNDAPISSVKEYILEKAREGKVTVSTVEGLMSIPLDDFVRQDTDGLLYDLNRGPEVVLTFIDDPKWVNDYAVSMVIKKLKEIITDLQK